MAKYTLHDTFEGSYRVSQPFGANPWYYKRFGFWGHEGVDFATPVGVKALAPVNGQILRTGWDKAYGNYIVVWDPKQLCAVWFTHLSKISVKGGQIVKIGQTIGLTGNTGNSTGPHLHIGFVETDRNATRKNRWNGYQGYLNCLDKNLVSWVLSR